MSVVDDCFNQIHTKLEELEVELNSLGTLLDASITDTGTTKVEIDKGFEGGLASIGTSSENIKTAGDGDKVNFPGTMEPSKGKTKEIADEVVRLNLITASNKSSIYSKVQGATSTQEDIKVHIAEINSLVLQGSGE